ncbi:MAG: pyridoxal 5'-phosphate synthase glutaminase subunit PdxT [Thermoplasmata archaeon]|nr:pyridoxal 5'-phosphate synthase glutaminase subunit PdxT [Thermoplasmata archaeon]
MKVGVLSLQGDYPEQAAAIRALAGDGDVRMVRSRADLEQVDALLMPGGESTTVGDLLDRTDLREPLAERIRDGLPVLATCAGLILLARTVEPSPFGADPASIGAIDVSIRRNDYGRQAESFEAPVQVEGLRAPFPGVFIRAPRITGVGAGVEVFARQGAERVGVRSGSIWGLTFHPELSPDRRVHELWLAAAGRSAQPANQKIKNSPSTKTKPTRRNHG